MGPVSPTTYCCSNNPQIDSVIRLDLHDFRHMDISTPDYQKKVAEFAQQFTQRLEINQMAKPIISRVIKNKQDHLLIALQNLETVQARNQFIRSINEKNLELVDALHYNLIEKNRRQQTNLSPCDFLDIDILDQKMRNQKFELGLNAIKNQQVCVLLLAGGANNRFHSTKFLKPIPNINKSIIELMFMRLNKLRKLAGNNTCPFNVFIMCSITNYLQIKSFLQGKQYYKFPQQFVNIIIQTEIPVISLNGQVIVNTRFDIVSNPRGTAEFIHLLNKNHVKDKVFNSKIKYLAVSGLENVLQRPCDPLLLGQMITDEAEIASKCVDPLSEQQQMLRYAKSNGIVKFIQPQILLKKYKTDDDIRFQKSPIALNTVIFKTQYLKSLLSPSQLHLINKQIHSTIRKFTYMNLRTETITPDQDCFVFQNHLGDLFLNANRVCILKMKREQDYAPVITEDKEYPIYSVGKHLEKIYDKRRINPESATLKMYQEEVEYKPSVVWSNYRGSRM